MLAAEKVLLANALSLARKSGVVDETIDLRAVSSLDDALAIQVLASLDRSDPILGYALAATSPASAKMLRCERPVYGPLFESARLQSGDTFKVAPNMIGVGAQLAFTFGRTYPHSNHDLSSPTLLADAIVRCCLSLQIVARRVPSKTPLNDWTATADFGLAGAYVEGPEIEHWRKRVFPTKGVCLRLDSHIVQRGDFADARGGPLHPILWLAETLHEQGRFIEAGSVVTTGSFTSLVQLTPGHSVIGDFGDLGQVSLALT